MADKRTKVRKLGARGLTARERGVASVLSMMFLILFGSLATAMAIASKGNLRTAATHLHVMRALGAAETGLGVARARLKEAASRFVVSNSQVDSQFGWGLWTGDMSVLGTYTILPPASGYPEPGGSSSIGLAQALANAHAADQNTVSGCGPAAPTIGDAMESVSEDEYMSDGWLYTPGVALEQTSEGGYPLAFSITYAPLANGTDVRAIVTGYDYGFSADGEPITRTVMEDFRIAKRVNQAIISPSRIMIGKNVLVTGDLGVRYTDVAENDGDPLLLKSDFFGMDADLDKKLTDLFAGIKARDADGDNRLRVGHPTEGSGIPVDQDYDGDGTPDGAFQDVTGDGYVDEFDVFIRHYDKNSDGRVVLSAALTAGTPAEGLTPEFIKGTSAVDDHLAQLLDGSNPDRNRNGVYGFVDQNGNGVWDASEPMLDYDADRGLNRDQVLGYRDGFIDKKDQYGKVKGSLSFKTTKAAWEAAQGSVADRIKGPVRASEGKAPVSYAVSDSLLPEVTASSFTGTDSALKSASDGDPFASQVAAALGVSTTALATYVETKPAGTTQPRFLRVDPDADLDGRPDNWTTAYFEKMPFNSPNYSDWYYRPVYENMTFRDVQIPLGTNALFRNCTFIGVTYVRTTAGNTHVLWSEYGKMKMDTASGRPIPVATRTIYGDTGTETSYPTMLPSTAVPPNQMILMALATPMDKGDLPASQAASTQGFSLLPDPLVIGGKRVTDTKPLSNNIRFHDCLFVGSIISDTPSNYQQTRNKLQFTGKTRFTARHPDHPEDPQYNPQSADEAEIAKSSMMLPNYSVDIGTFNSPGDQDIHLKGAVIAGVMDVRGNASVDGALLLTFKPTKGEGPLRDSQGNPIGNPAGFNTTIGYFGPDDGDSESLDPAKLPVVGGVKIVGWDTDGDGLADVGPDQAQPMGSTAVPFNGYGRIELRFDPNMVMPSGIMLPLRMDAVLGTYKEGHP
ncbi:MAG: hypothetical protein IT436_03815 [Phycisphaerales bacterium]|nr:hypothetical protein [Phycisphaerales bacterium]